MPTAFLLFPWPPHTASESSANAFPLIVSKKWLSATELLWRATSSTTRATRLSRKATNSSSRATKFIKLNYFTVSFE